MLSHRHVRYGGQFLFSPPLSPQCSHWVPICCWVNDERAFSQGIESGSNLRPAVLEACTLNTMPPRIDCNQWIARYFHKNKVYRKMRLKWPKS